MVQATSTQSSRRLIPTSISRPGTNRRTRRAMIQPLKPVSAVHRSAGRVTPPSTRTAISASVTPLGTTINVPTVLSSRSNTSQAVVTFWATGLATAVESRTAIETLRRSSHERSVRTRRRIDVGAAEEQAASPLTPRNKSPTSGANRERRAMDRLILTPHRPEGGWNSARAKAHVFGRVGALAALWRELPGVWSSIEIHAQAQSKRRHSPAAHGRAATSRTVSGRS